MIEAATETMIFKTACCLLAIWGQVSVIPLKIEQQVGSPLVAFGTLRTLQGRSSNGSPLYSFETDISVTNVSDKPILMFITRAHASGITRDNITSYRIHDFYFDENVFASREAKAFTETWLPESDTQAIHTADTRARASLSIAFVQFLDGTTWGDKRTGEEALCGRRLMIQELNNLVSLYQTRGIEEFQAELTREPSEVRCDQAVYFALMRATVSQVNTPEEKLTAINRMLRSARSHQTLADQK